MERLEKERQKKRKHRVDWDEEERLTERSRIRGLKWHLVTFSAVLLFLLMIKIQHREWSLGPSFLVLGGLASGTLLMILLAGRKNKK
jgi:YD repeat-containing protein